MQNLGFGISMFSWFCLMCPFYFETNLYSWNVGMIIWSANKAGYIIPGLWSTVDSSHNAVAHNKTGFSFLFLLCPTKHYEHQRQLALLQKKKMNQIIYPS